MYSVDLDTAEPDDRDFQQYLSDHQISQRLVNTQSGSGVTEYRYTARNRETLVALIEDNFDDGSGDLSYLTDLIEAA